MDETTETRTPLRCTASTRRRKSESPENRTAWSSLRGQLQHVDGELDIHVAFDPAAAQRIGEFLGGFGDQGVAVIGQPVGQRL